MGKTAKLRRAKTGRFQQRSMAETVSDNPVIFFHQRGNHRLICGETGNKQ